MISDILKRTSPVDLINLPFSIYAEFFKLAMDRSNDMQDQQEKAEEERRKRERQQQRNNKSIAALNKQTPHINPSDPVNNITMDDVAELFDEEL